MKSAEVNLDEARKAVEKLTSAEFFETVKTLADPALRAALTKLAQPASLDAIGEAGSLQDAVGTLVSPELEAAIERFNSPAVQEALRKASSALHAVPSKT